MTLSVWHDGEDWVIAESPEDATAVCVEKYGEYEGDGGWIKLEGHRKMRILGENEPAITLMCDEWIKRNGRGHLCSANW